MLWTYKKNVAVTGCVFTLVIVLFSGCILPEDDLPTCSSEELSHSVRNGEDHPNRLPNQVDGDVQAEFDETIELQTSPHHTCAQPWKIQWSMGQFDEEGVYEVTDFLPGDRNFELQPPAVGAFKLWMRQVDDPQEMTGEEPADEGLTLTVYYQDYYFFPSLDDPIRIEVPVVCCHAYDSEIWISNPEAGEELIYQINIEAKGTDGTFKAGPPPLAFTGEELNEWLGPRFQDTLVIEITSIHPEAPSPTLGHWFVVDLNVPDHSWP